MDNIQRTLERQTQATDYFRTRGDALVLLLDQMIADLEKNLNSYRAVRDAIAESDRNAGIEKKEINMQIVSVLRERFPDKTNGLSDEQVMEAVAQQELQ